VCVVCFSLFWPKKVHFLEAKIDSFLPFMPIKWLIQTFQCTKSLVLYFFLHAWKFLPLHCPDNPIGSKQKKCNIRLSVYSTWDILLYTILRLMLRNPCLYAFIAHCREWLFINHKSIINVLIKSENKTWFYNLQLHW
jgi:hypothetical protein